MNATMLASTATDYASIMSRAVEMRLVEYASPVSVSAHSAHYANNTIYNDHAIPSRSTDRASAAAASLIRLPELG